MTDEEIKNYSGDKKDGLRIYIQIKALSKLNIYLYGGPKGDNLRFHAN